MAQEEGIRMAIIAECYSADKELLDLLAARIARHAETVTPPEEVESPATLNLDLADLGRGLWHFLGAFGSIKATVETVKLIIEILRSRASEGKVSEVSVKTGDGGSLTLKGSMTPEEAAQMVTRFEKALAENKEGKKVRKVTK
jgi:hypothetical protein